jgi:hypothetical protein
LRLNTWPTSCWLAKGFTEIRYVTVTGSAVTQAFERGEIDFGLMFVPGAVRRLDAGIPITVLAGVHPGCFELFAHEPIQSMRDLKGKQVGIDDVLGTTPHLYVSIHGSPRRARPDCVGTNVGARGSLAERTRPFKVLY